MSSPVDEEIDLQSIATKVVRYFQRNLRILLVGSLIGALVGFIVFWIIPPVFESQMILTSDSLTNTYGARLSSTLNRLIDEKNADELSRRLSLSAEEAAGLREIEITRLGTDDRSTLLVTVKLRNTDILPRLQTGLINYMQDNEFVRTLLRQREESYKMLIEHVDEELRSLDSLKARLAQGKPVYSVSSGMLLLDPTRIYSEIMELNEKRLTYKRALELLRSIMLIEGFAQFDEPTFPKLKIMLAAGFILGLFTVMVFQALKFLLSKGMAA